MSLIDLLKVLIKQLLLQRFRTRYHCTNGTFSEILGFAERNFRDADVSQADYNRLRGQSNVHVHPTRRRFTLN